VKSVAPLSDPRIDALRNDDRWIKVPRFEYCLDLLERAFNAKTRGRPVCYIFIADASMGKTSIALRFLARHPPQRNPAAEHDLIPVLYVPVGDGPELGALLSRMLRLLGLQYVPPRRRIYELHEQVAALCKKLGVRMIIFDEIHHLLAGSAKIQERCRNFIKDLTNDLQIPIIAMGIESASQALLCDPQLRTRFRPVRISVWEYGDDLLNFLISLERKANLHQPSNLAQSAIVHKILEKTGGYTGLIIELVTEAAAEAIRDGSERITLETIEKCEWVPPAFPGMSFAF